ncbi:hypothetical protein GCM10009799_05150 [Nocardiopsis rhodophaea]|uniref:Uncharacterized protein n=1 Tax=Nocardiopsis rhodophaea TaxID=280238 RepID=A0ABN2S9R4_9ACTN
MEVIHARAVDADQIVGVGDVRRGRVRVRPCGGAHRVSHLLRGAVRRGRGTCDLLDGPALLLDTEQVPRGITEGAVANADLSLADAVAAAMAARAPEATGYR